MVRFEIYLESERNAQECEGFIKREGGSERLNEKLRTKSLRASQGPHTGVCKPEAHGGAM